MIVSAQAQNSNVEINQQVSKTEQFINSCSFYKTESFLELKDGGLYVTAMVITNLKTNAKIGTMFFQTKVDGKKLAAGITGTILGAQGSGQVLDDAGPKSLGYLDMDEIDDLINALSRILEATKEKHDVPYVISYVTKSGIDVTYNSESDKAIFSRDWHSINRYGAPIEGTVISPEVSPKLIAKTITTLEKAKTIINQNLQ